MSTDPLERMRETHFELSSGENDGDWEPVTDALGQDAMEAVLQQWFWRMNRENLHRS